MLFRRASGGEAERSRRALAALLRRLESRDAEARREAVRALGHTPGCPAVPALEAALRDPDEEVRTLAREGLERISDRELIGRLQDGSHTERCACARLLARRRCVAAVPALAEMLLHPNDDLAQTAFNALARIGDPAAARALVGAPSVLAGRSPLVLIRASREHLLPEAAPLLWGFLGHAAPDVVREAGLCLVEIYIPEDEPRDLLRPLFTRPKPMLHADRRLAPYLVGVLATGTRELRLTAARWLARIAAGDPSPAVGAAVPVLNRYLSVFSWTSDQDRDVYTHALDTISAAMRRLGHFPIPAAAPDGAPEHLPIPAAPGLGYSEALPLPDRGGPSREP